MEDFRPFDEPPGRPPFPQHGRANNTLSSKRPRPTPGARNMDDLARQFDSPPRYRRRELQRRGDQHVRRRRDTSSDFDSASSSDESFRSARTSSRRSTLSKSSSEPSSMSRGPRKKTAGPAGDPSARRQQLDETLMPPKSGIVQKLEGAITPLRVGILLGCFDLVGGSLTIWMTKRRNAKEKEAEAEKLALDAQAANGAGKEPVAPRGDDRRRRNRVMGGSSSSSGSRDSMRRDDRYRRRG